jgi:signal transduction histidine kinase
VVNGHSLIPASWRKALAVFRVGAALYAFTVASQSAGSALAAVYLVLAAGSFWVAASEWEKRELVVLAADIGFTLLASASDNFSLFLWCFGVLAGNMVIVALHRRRLSEWAALLDRKCVAHQAESEAARASERERFAQDFHDGPMQAFTSLHMRLGVVRKLLERDPGAATAELEEFQSAVARQVAEMREFMRYTRDGGTEDQDTDLFTAAAGLARVFERDAGIPVMFTHEGDGRPVDGKLAIEALHIIREALHNILKHSGATNASVSAIAGEDLSIQVEDNGRGYSFRGAYRLDELESMQLGPESIRKRVKACGGNLMLESRPGQGSRLLVSLPR